MNEQNVTIKNIEIPIIIKSYKTSKSVKIFFKNDKITITKPKRFSNKNLIKIIDKNEDFIYTAYLEGIKKNKESTNYFETGETLYYKAEKYEIIREWTTQKNVKIYIEDQTKQIKILVPRILEEKDISVAISKKIKELYKLETAKLIENRLPYWSGITGIKYNTYTVRDSKTRYGSCIPKKKLLHFSSRLVMLEERMIDAIIVHELCHMVYPNHSKDFYNLVEKYIEDYKDISKWLKKNVSIWDNIL